MIPLRQLSLVSIFPSQPQNNTTSQKLAFFFAVMYFCGIVVVSFFMGGEGGVEVWGSSRILLIQNVHKN